MKAFLFLLLVALTCLSCGDKGEPTSYLAGPLPAEKAAYQKALVGQLSGEFPLADQKTFMKSRWSGPERRLALAYLKELIATLGIEPQTQAYRSPNLNPAIDLLLEPFKGTNVYGILPATTSSDAYVVLGAHYDTGKRQAPGAIDNATGIALIYSVLKELTQSPHRDKHVVIVFFDQEEEELIGSKAFARFIQAQSWNIHSIHCFDMVGWDEDGDRAMEVFSPSPALMQAYSAAAGRHQIPLKKIVIDPAGYDRNSTDFDAFVPQGVPVIGAGECYYHRDSTPFKDTPADTFETVNFPYLLSCSNLIGEIIQNMVTQ